MEYLNSGQTERTQAGGSTFKNGPMGLSINSSGPLSSTSYVRTPEGELVSMRTGGVAHYYLFDRLGSVVALTDSAGNPVNRYFYDPFGNYETGTTEMVANPWQFAGGFKDAFSGYYKFGARYYDPTLGRWTQPDPSGQDANSYAYSNSCPTNFVDPSGMKGTLKCNKSLARFANVIGYGGALDALIDIWGGNNTAAASKQLGGSAAQEAAIKAAESAPKVFRGRIARTVGAVGRFANAFALPLTFVDIGCLWLDGLQPNYDGTKPRF